MKISTQAVKEQLIALTERDESELEAKAAVIDSAVSFVEKLVKTESEDDMPRLIMLAAARANYSLALLNRDESGISSFTAGDVSFTKSASDMVDSARAFYESTLGESTDIIRENGFVFRTV